MKQDKYTLATAGFFYSKEGNIVECFTCGVRLSQWTLTGIPIIEHEKCSPHCMYIQLIGFRSKETNRQDSWLCEGILSGIDTI